MKCVICGNDVKMSSNYCSSCGASQDLEPTYYAYINVEEYLKNNNLKEVPYKERYHFIQDGKYMIYKRESKYDFIALGTCSMGIYFTFKFISNMSEGIVNVISKNNVPTIIENKPILNLLYIVWPLIIFPIIAFVYSKKGRKIQKNSYNLYSYLGSIMELTYAFIISIHIYINLIN